jgi:hypothetical protein
MKRFVFGTAAMLVFVATALWLEGADLLKLFLPTPLMITVGAPLCALLAIWDLGALRAAWRAAFDAAAEERTREAAAKVWNFLEKAFYAAGALGFIAGAIIIFANPIATPVDVLRPFSIDLVAPLWAVVLAMVARILRYRVVTRNSRG